MTAPQPQLIGQFTGHEEKFRERLTSLLRKPGLRRVRIAVAFARWDGLGLLADDIEALLRRGGRFETIYGAGNGITTADALYYGLVLRKLYPKRTYAAFIEDEYSNASFHPKFYEFQSKDETRVIVGSANLTGGGLCRNSEAGVELVMKRKSPEEKVWDAYWKSAASAAIDITAAAVDQLVSRPGAGRERGDESGGAKQGKPFLKQHGRAAPKPLFRKILGLPKLTKTTKGELLAEMSGLTEKPSRLYIQIWDRETGGTGGKPGTAVQFPVATLGTFFGIGKSEAREITVNFPNEAVTTTFMHLKNDTHRLRLSPILTVERPTVLILDRKGPDRYAGRFVAKKDYARILQDRCTQQSTSRSRKWGFG